MILLLIVSIEHGHKQLEKKKVKSAFFEERGRKRDKLTITDNSAPGKVKNNESDQASRWSKMAWREKKEKKKKTKKAHVTAAFADTQPPVAGKNTTQVLVKMSERKLKE